MHTLVGYKTDRQSVSHTSFLYYGIISHVDDNFPVTCEWQEMMLPDDDNDDYIDSLLCSLTAYGISTHFRNIHSIIIVIICKWKCFPLSDSVMVATMTTTSVESIIAGWGLNGCWVLFAELLKG